eukprot:m.17205 g.17205  ORF g.17205 m.17205 type:complete len:406 (+) comp5941_c0_seq1:168-1385(+)
MLASPLPCNSKMRQLEGQAAQGSCKDKENMEHVVHIMRPKDTLEYLLVHYDVTVSDLHTLNPEIPAHARRGHFISSKELRIPTVGGATSPFRTCTTHSWCRALRQKKHDKTPKSASQWLQAETTTTEDAILARVKGLLDKGNGSQTYTRVKTILIKEFGRQDFEDHKEAVVSLLEESAMTHDRLTPSPLPLASSEDAAISVREDKDNLLNLNALRAGSSWLSGNADFDPIPVSDEAAVVSGTGELRLQENPNEEVDMTAAMQELNMWQQQLTITPNTTEEEEELRAHLNKKIKALEDKICRAGGNLKENSTGFLQKFDKAYLANKSKAEAAITGSDSACLCCGVVLSPWIRRPATCSYNGILGSTVEKKEEETSDVARFRSLGSMPVKVSSVSVDDAWTDEVFEL